MDSRSPPTQPVRSSHQPAQQQQSAQSREGQASTSRASPLQTSVSSESERQRQLMPPPPTTMSMTSLSAPIAALPYGRVEDYTTSMMSLDGGADYMSSRTPSPSPFKAPYSASAMMPTKETDQTDRESVYSSSPFMRAQKAVYPAFAPPYYDASDSLSAHSGEHQHDPSLLPMLHQLQTATSTTTTTRFITGVNRSLRLSGVAMPPQQGEMLYPTGEPMYHQHHQQQPQYRRSSFTGTVPYAQQSRTVKTEAIHGDAAMVHEYAHETSVKSESVPHPSQYNAWQPWATSAEAMSDIRSPSPAVLNSSFAPDSLSNPARYHSRRLSHDAGSVSAAAEASSWPFAQTPVDTTAARTSAAQVSGLYAEYDASAFMRGDQQRGAQAVPASPNDMPSARLVSNSGSAPSSPLSISTARLSEPNASRSEHINTMSSPVYSAGPRNAEYFPHPHAHTAIVAQPAIPVAPVQQSLKRQAQSEPVMATKSRTWEGAPVMVVEGGAYPAQPASGQWMAQPANMGVAPSAAAPAVPVPMSMHMQMPVAVPYGAALPNVGPRKPRRRMQPGNDKIKYICNFCGKGFPNYSGVERHERTHTGEAPYACMYCSRRFKQKGTLTSHMRIHTGEQPFACPAEACKVRFRHRSSLRRHLRSCTFLADKDKALADTISPDSESSGASERNEASGAATSSAQH